MCYSLPERHDSDIQANRNLVGLFNETQNLYTICSKEITDINNLFMSNHKAIESRISGYWAPY